MVLSAQEQGMLANCKYLFFVAWASVPRLARPTDGMCRVAGLLPRRWPSGEGKQLEAIRPSDSLNRLLFWVSITSSLRRGCMQTGFTNAVPSFFLFRSTNRVGGKGSFHRKSWTNEVSAWHLCHLCSVLHTLWVVIRANWDSYLLNIERHKKGDINMEPSGQVRK